MIEPAKHAPNGRIFRRVALLSCLLVVATLAAYLAQALPLQRKINMDHLSADAQSVAVSIAQVTATAIIDEDYSFAIDHCNKVVQQNPLLRYVVITRQDGYSLIHTKSGWRQDELAGVWTRVSNPSGAVASTGIVDEPVFHYTYPFEYSGIDWGYIHIGFSLERFNSDMRTMYWRTGLMTLVCLAAGFLAAFVFARQITTPIQALDEVTQRVAAGDLAAVAEVDTGDELARLAASFNRMTESLRRTEADLKAAKDEAEAATRSKSQFLANMSHELRTPFNGVLGMTELLLATELTETQRRYAETSYVSGQRLLALLNDILDFSKIEAGKLSLQRRAFSPTAAVGEVVALLRARAASRGLDLRFSPNPSIPPWVWGDQLRFSQILVNLVSNALKFTESGGVFVALEHGTTPESIRTTVRDTGIGIAPEARAIIFDAFSQADVSAQRRFQGTGLGLAISKQLVDLMDGTIGVTSEPGAGSTFWFEIPFERAPDSQETTAALPPPRRAFTVALSGSLLLVEDNEVNQFVAREMLSRLGLEVTTASDGYQALEATATRAFDLILMDCQMPRMDGYQATRAIRAREAEAHGGHPEQTVPIVAMTALAMQSDRDACFAAGMNDYITKPFVLGDLTAVVSRALKQKSGASGGADF
ncbi:MAG: ATP-binding protein [Vicinamibacteria bacterium]